MIKSHQNFDLSGHNTFAMPVKCGCFMEYDSVSDIPFLLSSIRPGVDFYHIGAGSNLLFTADYPGVVAHSAIKGIEIVAEEGETVLVRVGSGVAMDDFISWACGRRLWGAENLSGIPGEAGAAAVQNVGAYGVEAADIIDSIYAFDRSAGDFVILDPKDCGYGYRQSMFKLPANKGNYVIATVTFRLSTQPAPVLTHAALAKKLEGTTLTSPAQIREAVIAVRDSKLPDPAKVPSAGSFFKNPVVSRELFDEISAREGGNVPRYDAPGGVKIPAAWLIEQCGWKGKTHGNAAVWHLQPLVIVNPDRKASPQEIIELEKAIIQSVKQKFSITLNPEVEHI